jgi:hypothetical protein
VGDEKHDSDGAGDVPEAAATPTMKASPSTVFLGSFRGQRLVAGRGVSVAARRSVVVRARSSFLGLLGFARRR